MLWQRHCSNYETLFFVLVMPQIFYWGAIMQITLFLFSFCRDFNFYFLCLVIFSFYCEIYLIIKYVWWKHGQIVKWKLFSIAWQLLNGGNICTVTVPWFFKKQYQIAYFRLIHRLCHKCAFSLSEKQGRKTLEKIKINAVNKCELSHLVNKYTLDEFVNGFAVE